MKNKDTAEFFEALRLLEKEKGIPMDYLAEKIGTAIAVAVKKDSGGSDENVFVDMDPANNTLTMGLRKTVVEELVNPETEMLPDEALRYSKTAKVGDIVTIELEPKQFGRIAAQAAKHVIRQALREAERSQQFQEFQDRNQEMVSAQVLRIDPITGAAAIKMGKNESVLSKSEQIAGEVLKEGSFIKVYVVDVKDGEKGPRALISRTHPGLVRRLFEQEVPEIFDGTVEVRSVSREAGSRTKIAVFSTKSDVDAVGACIGQRGARVNKIVEELGGEKIDVVEYSEDPAAFIAAALSPAKVLSVEVAADGSKSCRVCVPDDQLSLAIGNKGQNARLAAKLTGWKIDIRPESESASL